MEVLKREGVNVVKYGGGVMIANLSGLSGMVRDKVGQKNKVMIYGSDGLVYSSVSEGVDMAFGDPNTLIQHGDVAGFVDLAVFLSLVSAGVNESGLVRTVFDAVSGISPLDREINLALVEGGIVAGGRIIGEYIDRTPMIPDIVKYGRHITRLWMPQTQ